MKDYDNILLENSASMKDSSRKSWWNKRYKLDEKLKVRISVLLNFNRKSYFYRDDIFGNADRNLLVE